ncbi:MAG TPA: triose-phosphate isomerase [Candidatus Enterousia avicola]|uniref:Triosephosphate isomerase n=1 Tax=Candidatus Enterousia avicola TaxID=2840787 RepID=A0A9D1MS48_9PROT|nr:triose-phosphate isomerase [Candidatus Enterousia avicola]
MKVIAGNWKMNGSRASLQDMVKSLQNVETENEIILCVPYTMLGIDGGRVSLGAQDVSTHDHGAYTGEVSAQMIADTGAKYVIVGHSERRQYHNETNDIVRQKVQAALSAGLTPIVCVGETMEEKQAGKTMEIIESGVRESIPNDIDKDIIVAYEPRWAIGAGLTPTTEEIAEAHKLIADTLSDMGLSETPVLYGASVKGSNAESIMTIPNVDGVLVGGASLKPDDFIPIITSVK